MIKNDNIVTLPCPHMMFDKNNHYHECELMPYQNLIDPITHEDHGLGFCCCAWFYDAAGPTVHLETSVVNGKLSIISDKNFPDIPRENEPQESNVPKICPKSYTWKQINAKMKVFDPAFFSNKVLT